MTDLYLQEKQEQLKTAASAKLKYQMTVPGILNPHEVTEENMNDWEAPLRDNLSSCYVMIKCAAWPAARAVFVRAPSQDKMRPFYHSTF